MKTESKISDSMILNLHDWEIIGIEILKSGLRRDILLKFCSEGMQIRKIKFNEIIFLNCSGFTWQNVVSDVHVFDISKMNQREISSEISRSGVENNYLNLELETLDSGYMIAINPSVGAEILIVCTSYSMEMN